MVVVEYYKSVCVYVFVCVAVEGIVAAAVVMSGMKVCCG